MYKAENYRLLSDRFAGQYKEVHRFLKTVADKGMCEHFHWGRFDWMMTSQYLDRDKASNMALFRDGSGEIAGLALFDTSYDDRWYFLRAVPDRALLEEMVEYAIRVDGGETVIRANELDRDLCTYLDRRGFGTGHAESVLTLSLEDGAPRVSLPDGFGIVREADDYNWNRVIWRGFDHDGDPEPPDAETSEAEARLRDDAYIKSFVVSKDGEYAAYCGVWYDGGETAYIEPVATVPEHRRKGLGRAVVYDAVGVAASRGAKRAIVLSDQEFYLRIGMTVSSQVTVRTLRKIRI